MSSAEAFNRSWFSRFINSKAGRAFRLVVGVGILVVGYLFRNRPLGLILIAFSIFPLFAGAFDLCYISAILGGPLFGAKIREAQHKR